VRNNKSESLLQGIELGCSMEISWSGFHSESYFPIDDLIC
jgi:hypothetical protein